MKDYYKDLSLVQNYYTAIDIMTITALMSKAEKINHLMDYAKKAKLWDMVKKWENIQFDLNIDLCLLVNE